MLGAAMDDIGVDVVERVDRLARATYSTCRPIDHDAGAMRVCYLLVAAAVTSESGLDRLCEELGTAGDHARWFEAVDTTPDERQMLNNDRPTGGASHRDSN